MHDSNLSHAEQVFQSIRFESITDHPNILIAAAFWDQERYQAARECYRIMRYIDDLIDHHKSEHRQIPPADREQFSQWVVNWLEDMKSETGAEPEHTRLLETISRFRIPYWPFSDFARAMIYDIHHDGFPTLKDFFTYTEGASLAPASIFVHLCGLRRRHNEYDLPLFDVRETAMPCAYFSYLVHIVRDFMKDHRSNLNYFPLDLMAKHRLTCESLRSMAHGAPLTPGFRDLMHEYKGLAHTYLEATQQTMQRVIPLLDEGSRLSLEIVFSLYAMVYERIDPDHGSFTPEELNPTPAETRQCVHQAIRRVNQSVLS